MPEFLNGNTIKNRRSYRMVESSHAINLQGYDYLFMSSFFMMVYLIHVSKMVLWRVNQPVIFNHSG